MHMAVLTEAICIIQIVIQYKLRHHFLILKTRTSDLYAVIQAPRNICYVRGASINAEKQSNHMLKLLTGFIGIYCLHLYSKCF